jgi:hypothetical protein
MKEICKYCKKDLSDRKNGYVYFCNEDCMEQYIND